MGKPRNLPQWRYPDSTYFCTWRLHTRGDILNPAERTIVATNLEHLNEQRYRLAGYVVMDDHVHVLVFPLGEQDLGKLLHGWKSFTSNEINRQRGVTGTRWQKDTHTEIMRNHAAIRSRLQYIWDNPRRKWPEITQYPWLKVFDVL
jgi:REP element-mobilizing transposase RayT